MHVDVEALRKRDGNISAGMRNVDVQGQRRFRPSNAEDVAEHEKGVRANKHAASAKKAVFRESCDDVVPVPAPLAIESVKGARQPAERPIELCLAGPIGELGVRGLSGDGQFGEAMRHGLLDNSTKCLATAPVPQRSRMAAGRARRIPPLPADSRHVHRPPVARPRLPAVGAHVRAPRKLVRLDGEVANAHDRRALVLNRVAVLAI